MTGKTRHLRRRAAGIFAVLIAATAIVAVTAVTAPAAVGSGSVTGDKSVTPGSITCDGSAQVTLTLTGQNGIAGTPTDIELVLDRSGSMGGTPLTDLKSAADAFVDIIDQATDGSLDGTIANGSRIGVVSFASTATVDQSLTSATAGVHSAINALVAGGTTNHQAAISTAQAQLAGSNPASTKIMIIFTDGQTTVGTDAQAEAAAARAAGTEIYAIGLGSVNTGQLDGWATDPDGTHVFLAPSSSDLQTIFNGLGAAIVVPAATGIQVVDTVVSAFTVSGASASAGTVSTAGNVLTWNLDSLGTESQTLTYTVTHDPTQPGGTLATNDSVQYSDSEGHAVSFPSPTVGVHGCAAQIDLAPASATNELGTPGQTHTVTATVTDDFGDPVGGVPVGFSISTGPNAGATGSGTTDSSGQVPFTYTAAQGPAGLGTDTIGACFTSGEGQGPQVCASATKLWQDTTPPTVECMPTTNPSGGNVPPAGDNPKSGQNPDGFYVLTASDAVDPTPSIYVADSGSAFVAGGFPSGTTIKLVQAPGATPNQKPGTGAIDWKLTLNGDAQVYAVDASGNQSTPISCNVPPPPK